ncbi:TLC domain-containing protein [Melampsora americana]|nr:TLC domain-containing protein [Melampsora americana]
MIESISGILQLTNLSLHLPIIIISTFTCFFLQYLSNQILSPKLFPIHYQNLSTFTKFNWDTHFVAWIHSFYATFIGIYFLCNYHQFQDLHDDKLFGYHPFAMNLLSISTGYFLWDIAVSTLMVIKGNGIGFFLHAASCFVAFLYTIKPFAGYYGFVFLLWESSTIFLNPHWFFDKIGMTGSKAQMYNGIALLISFFLSRLVLGNYVSYEIFVTTSQPGVSERVGRKTLNTILSLDILLSILNVYWFYQMISSIKKRMNPKLIKKN